MNGPYELRDWGASVFDRDGREVAECPSRPDAHTVCAALNAVYYAQQAAKATTSQGEGTP